MGRLSTLNVVPSCCVSPTSQTNYQMSRIKSHVGSRINQLTWWCCIGWIRPFTRHFRGRLLLPCLCTWWLGSILSPRQVVPRLPNGLDNLRDHLKIKQRSYPDVTPVWFTSKWKVESGPTFLSAGVASTGGRRNSSESGPGSNGSPQSKRVCPGISWRVTNDPEDSEDQGSEAEDTMHWIMRTNHKSWSIHTNDWILEIAPTCTSAVTRGLLL